MNNKLLEIKDLKVHFHLDEGTVKAVNGVSYDIYEGKTLGVVGESGCGKSVTAQAIMRIVPHPGRICDNSQILLHRQSDNEKSKPIDLVKFENDGPEIRAIRGSEIAMIFQEPMTAFSPMYTIGNQIIEAVVLHQKISKKEAREKTIEMLNVVGIPKPSRRVDAYSFELSGGLRQRAMIAMALSCQPNFLIADEPTTALDVTVQAQILELLRDLQVKMGMAVQLITHDLGVIAEMAQEVIVMYMGSIVEQASVDTIFHSPQHPYTRALLKSIPHVQTASSRLGFIEGMVPDAFEKIEGCPFYPRCSERDDVRCLKNRKQAPLLHEIEPGHKVACYLFGDEVSE
ncbi:ABC transporter ATP-binding protein [bacterium]|nr:ABC transporter ATP-binding protein [bacterium]